MKVTRHLSPFEQQVMVPWLKTFPKRVRAFNVISLKLFILQNSDRNALAGLNFHLYSILPFLFTHKAYAKFADSGPYLVGTFILVWGTAELSDAADAAQDRSYRY